MKLLNILTFFLFLNSFVYANIGEIKKSEEKNEIIEKTFEEKSEAEIKHLLKSKKPMLLFTSKRILKSYYKTFNYQLIWSNDKELKNIAIELLNAIKNDPVLKPHVKKLFKLEQIINSLNTLDKTPQNYIKSMAQIDLMLTGLYSKYMRYLARGFINWDSFKKELKNLEEKSEINGGWEKYNVRKSYKKLLQKAVEENNLSLAFDEVNYTFPKANALSKKILEFEELAKNGGYIKIPKSKVLKPGQKSQIIKVLRQRLIQSDDLKDNICDIQIENESSHKKNQDLEKTVIITQGSDIIENDCYEVFDETLKKAVISFQENHGLVADGIVGPKTKRFLNKSVESKILQMRLNLERMRWLPRSLGEKYLLVNIPEYKLKMYENDEIKLKMRVVVGKRKHPTPIFSNKMSFVVLNPYWKIPHSIVRKEVIPEILKNPNYLMQKDINVHENWDHKSDLVDQTNIDWSAYLQNLNLIEKLKKEKQKDEELLSELKKEVPLYRFIQIPSNKNPLGRMKFMFPNKYSVYLHDSPAKRIFKYTKRAYSHGCVRLAEPKKLLEAIASNDPNLDYEKATKVLEEIDKTQIHLDKQIPVHMVYLTSWVDEKGKIQFREDIYKYDKMQKKLLYKAI